MAWRPLIDQERRDREDHQAERGDRRIARLAARELAAFMGGTTDAHDAWLIFTRLKALRRDGVSVAEIMRRLAP